MFLPSWPHSPLLDRSLELQEQTQDYQSLQTCMRSQHQGCMVPGHYMGKLHFLVQAAVPMASGPVGGPVLCWHAVGYLSFCKVTV